jgi:hypothetical protein
MNHFDCKAYNYGNQDLSIIRPPSILLAESLRELPGFQQLARPAPPDMEAKLAIAGTVKNIGILLVAERLQ